MSTLITIYGSGLASLDDIDSLDSASTVGLKTPRNVPDFNDQLKLQVPGEIIRICSGLAHILALGSDGTLYSYGSNQFGQRGTNGAGFKAVLKNVEHMAAGLYHSVAIVRGNKVFAWGRGTEGQLGLGDNENQETPQELSISGQEVACGSFHTIIRFGDVGYVMGENQNGQLGVAGEVNKPTKLRIPIDQMAAGLDHSIFLSKGQVYVTGNNLFGQCGVSEQILREPTKLNLQIEVSRIFSSMGTFSGVMSKSGRVYFWGTGSWGYARKCTPIEELCKIDDVKISDVLMGENFALLKMRNEWYVFGLNKLPDNYNSSTHRIPLGKVELPNCLIALGLNTAYTAEYKKDQQIPNDQPKLTISAPVKQQPFRESINIQRLATQPVQSYCPPIQQSHNVPMPQQKCQQCEQSRVENEYLQRAITNNIEDVQNLKREIEFLKGQIKQKDQYTQELENRVLKGQDSNTSQVKDNYSTVQYKPHLETRLKSEEKTLNNDIYVSKIFDYSPNNRSYNRVIDTSPNNRNINTSIIDKIQNYQMTQKSRQIPLLPRHSLAEVQNTHTTPTQSFIPNQYILPSYYKGR